MMPVLSALVGKDIENPRTVIEQGFRGKSTETAGCLMRVNTAYSICEGTVIAVGKSVLNNTWCVTISIGTDRWIRYCNLLSTGVLVSKNIKKGDFIGYGTDGYIQFEYCTAEKSNYPVRLLGTQLYKHDPTPILFSKTDISEM